jgi:hypothetical protein
MNAHSFYSLSRALLSSEIVGANLKASEGPTDSEQNRLASLTKQGALNILSLEKEALAHHSSHLPVSMIDKRAALNCKMRLTWAIKAEFISTMKKGRL